MSKAFGELLNTYIGFSRYSQSQLANEVGINRSHLNRAINGQRNLGQEAIVKIADKLGVPMDERARLYLLAIGYSSEEVAKLLANR